MSDMGNIESQLKSHVRLSGCSLYKISKDSGISLSYLSRWMNGHQALGKRSIDTLCDTLRLSVRLEPSNYVRVSDR